MGIFGEPAAFYALALLKDFADAPEAAEGGNGQDRLPEEVVAENRDNAGYDADNKKCPPAFHAEIVFAFDNKRMEQSDYEESCRADGEAEKVMVLQEFCHKSLV